MSTLVLDAPGTPTARARERHRSRDAWPIRAAIHLACWIPFITTAADSWRGPWRAVGDNARMAFESWSTLSGWIPLVGQPNELPGAPHDPGPLQYWLLAIPVHADAARGVLWGAVLLAMLAVSLTVEAGYSVLGEKGALLAGGAVIAVLTWFPGFAARPEDNPDFGLIFFVATCAVAVAVLSGHRRWWPVLVVTASIAAQAHLTYAAASVGLVLIALGTGLADEFRAKGGYSWLIAGLIAGAACWIAPLDQQFTSPAGHGNMSLLLHAESEGQHVGVAFAMKAMASLTAPSSLWWQQNISQRHDLYQLLGSKPAALGVVILVITTAILVMAGRWLRSRELVSLAAVSLLVSSCAAASLALVPERGLAGQQHDLIYVLFAAVVLAWLTAGGAAVLVAVRLTTDRRGRAGPATAQAPTAQAPTAQAPARQERRRPAVTMRPARWAVALLLVTTVLLGAARQVNHYHGAGANSLRVGTALAMIERSLPRQPVIALSISAPRETNRYQVFMGLCWALTADGLQPYGYHPENRLSRRTGILPEIAVALSGPNVRVTTLRISQRTRGLWSPCTGHRVN
jgi:hypothetical protein